MYFEKVMGIWIGLGSLLYIYSAREDSVLPWMHLQRQFFRACNPFFDHETPEPDLETAW